MEDIGRIWRIWIVPKVSEVSTFAPQRRNTTSAANLNFSTIRPATQSLPGKGSASDEGFEGRHYHQYGVK
jgi:hypothetical protein